MKKFISGALIGAAVAGTVVALTTPKKGSELRADIKKEAVKVKEQGEVVVEKVKIHGEDVVSKASEVYETTHDKAIETAHNLKDKLPCKHS